MFRWCRVGIPFLFLLGWWGLCAQAGYAAEGGANSADRVAVFRIPPVLTEADSLDEFSALFLGGEVTTFRSLTERMTRAIEDKKVAAVVLQGQVLTLGPAQIEELRRIIDRIKAAGKPVYAHVDQLDMDKYVLLSGVSRLGISPTGDVWVTGIYSESPYIRGLLDKLGVEPDFTTCGAYKSAAEIFTHQAPSVEAKENREWLLDGMYATYVRLISEGRRVPTEKVESWINTGLFSAEAALQEGIVDAVEYHQDFVAYIKKSHGDSVQFDKRYGRAQQKQIDLSSPLGLFQFYAELLGGSKPKTLTKDTVAVVYVEGPILPGSPSADPFSFSGGGAYSTPIRAALEKVERDPKVKAVVLRVDSPGGSVVASEIILDATRRVQRVKPLVVSMGNVAGSGGYYVSCGADTVFAEATTITGSIGVVGGKLATRGLWQKLGVHWEPSKRGEHAGMLYSADKFTATERQRLQHWMDEVYEAFKNRVTTIRGSRLKKQIEDLAGGRVYTGQQALELGLVDRLGGLSEAIQFVAEQAGLQAGQYEVRSFPEPPSVLDALLGQSESDRDPTVLQLRQLLAQQLTAVGWNAAWWTAPEPRRARLLTEALTQLCILQRERVGLFMAPTHAGGSAR